MPPFQYNPTIDEFGKEGGGDYPSSGNPGGPGGVGPGVGGIGGAGSLSPFVSYDPTSPLFGRRRPFATNRIAAFNSAPFGGILRQGAAGVSAPAPASASPFSATGSGGGGGGSILDRLGLGGRGLGGGGGDPSGYSFGGFFPYGPNGNFSVRQLLEQITGRGLGSGYLDPSGEGPLLKLLEQESMRNLGAAQSGELAHAQASGADPAQIASAALEGGLRNRSATAGIVSSARIQQAQQVQELYQQILAALFGAEGMQKVGKYDAGRSGAGGGVSFGIPGIGSIGVGR